MEARIRPVRDDDSLDLIALIARCWSEYPGCVLDVHGEEPDLLAPASAYQRAGGILWVAEGRGGIAACGGVRPSSADGTAELIKLYVDPTWRRRGLGRALSERIERRAREMGATRIELWSDTRFETAHRLYVTLGYEDLGETRDLHDLSDTTELHYAKSL